MKTLLIFLALALSMNVIAQTKPLLPCIKNTEIRSKINLSLKLLKRDKGMLTFTDQDARTKNFLAASPLDLVPIYDSIYMWVWDSANSEWLEDIRIIDILTGANNLPTSYTTQALNGISWENSGQYFITYDANNNVTNELEKYWNGIEWVNYFQTTYTYDNNNNLLSFSYQFWGETGWENQDQFVYTYDSNNNQTSELYQSWDSTGWQNNILLTTFYDVNNNKTSELSQNWDGDSWENIAQLIYLYDASSRLERIESQYWDGSMWVAVAQFMYSYDANNNVSEEIYQQWNGIAWENASRNSYTYDGSNQLASLLIESWDGVQWQNETQIFFTYDGNNNFTSSTYENWNGNEWVRVSVISTGFDENSFIINEVNKYYDNTGAIVQFGDSIHYYFHTIVGVKELEKESTITVYPNPSGGMFTVTSSDVFTNIEIYNVLGGRVFTNNTNSQQRLEIDLSEDGSGIYFIIMQDGVNYYNKKIIVR